MGDKVELRIVRADEEEEFLRLIHYAFGLDKDYSEWTEIRCRRRPEPETMEHYGYFVDGRMASTCALLPLRFRSRGSVVDVGGISEVSTPPEFRRRGYVADMLSNFLAILEERNMYVSALWPFSREFYSRYGWATCAESSRVTLTTENLKKSLRGFKSTARFEPAKLDDVDELDEAHRDWGSTYNLSVLRDLEGWRTQVFCGWKRNPYVYLARDAGDRVIGHVAYTVQDRDDWDRDLTVTDISYVDMTAYREILSFLANHDSQINRFHFAISMSDPLFDWIPEGKVERRAGIMVRVSDVRKSLERLDVPADLKGSMILSVSDNFMPANSGSVAIEVHGGRILTHPTESSPDVEMDVKGYTQLYTGYRSADDLHRLGLLDDHRGTREFLGTLLPPMKTYMPEHF